ncbi:hypothetical protein [Hyphomonas sp.]|jgi:hypothetical protein|uniref:hypothetical protein n=1 Tax=Hyphomonas sp. TaxID=87 RepID=UPI0037C119B5
MSTARSGFLSFALITALVAFAPAVAAQTDVFELPLQGIQIESGANGEWERIYATGVQPVEFPDRRGITTAQRIAEQRAKAEIVKFFDQEMSAETIVSEMEATTQVSTRQLGSSGESFGKESQRVLATSLSEVLRSYSSSTLRGVMVLESGYDEASEEAWVKVGISRGSLAMASAARSDMTAGGQTLTGAQAAGAGQVVTQPTEVRKGVDLP